MSDENQNNKNQLFSNADTIVRRNWIESAVQSARSSLFTGPLDSAALPDAAVQPEKGKARQPERRGPYLAWSAGERRSGT